MGGPATSDPRIRFDDGAAYERMMGVWSRLAGETFLDWLAPPPGSDWIDIGCGNGAFTELAMQRCAPNAIHGIDVSPEQIAYAKTRAGARGAAFQTGDAMALPFGDRNFDIAVMALVIFFVPDPAKAVSEMRRVLRGNGIAAAYVWDIANAGSPIDPIRAAMAAAGLAPLKPPSAGASEAERLRTLWSQAGFEAVETCTIKVERTFPDFDDFWQTTLAGSILGPQMAALPAGDVDKVRARVKADLGCDGNGRVTYGAIANGVKGRLRSD